MRPIYKVTSKKITEMLEKELKRKERYVPSILRKVNKFDKNVVAISCKDSDWRGELIPQALVFSGEFEKTMDMKEWKVVGDVVHKGVWKNTYWPKENTNKGKKLATSYRNIMSSEKFFQSDEILEVVGYKPKKNVETKDGMLRVNTFGVGYKRDKAKKSITFMFSGYTGYKPVRGIKEMYISEYNKIIGN